MFHHPFIDHILINERSRQFQFFDGKNLEFPLNNEHVGEMENYLGRQSAGSFLAIGMSAFRKKFLGYIGLGQEYNMLKTGICATVKVLADLKVFLSKIQQLDPQNPYHKDIELLDRMFLDKRVV